MADGESKLAVALSELRRHVADLELRLAEVEAKLRISERATKPVSREAGEQRVEAAAPAAEEARFPALPGGLVALLGRTLIALGGAFLLRALTESGSVPGAPAAWLGLAYALAWTWMADRAARRGHTVDATLHGLATTLIAFPLVWETATRFAVMNAPVAAATLTVVALMLLGVAWRRGLAALAWMATLASTATGVSLLFKMQALAPFAASLFILAALSLAVAYHRDWYGLRWPAALSLDALVLLAIYLVGKTNYEWLQPSGVAAVQLLMTAMYLGTIGTRTLLLGHPTREFGIIQSLLVLAIGFEGARYVLGPDFAWASAFPVAALGLAGACYAVSFLYLERDVGQRGNLAWYLTLGTILFVYAFALLTPERFAGLPWALMALVGAALGRRDFRKAARWNAAALALAAAVGSGLVGAAYQAFVAADAVAWLVFPAAAGAVAALCLAAWVVLRWAPATLERSSDQVIPGLTLLGVAAVGFGSAVVAVLGPHIAAAASAAADLGALAVLRTAVLVGASLLLAASSRLRPRDELVWIAYAALAIGACKIAIEDLPNGRAMTMFLSFVLFGGALIATPRLVPEREQENHGRES